MKKLLSLSVLGLSVLALTACGPAGEKSAESATEQEVLRGDYVGMSVTQAQARAKADNTPFRIVMADGEAFAVTADYRPGRINATVENGVVASYQIEGDESL